MSKTAVGPYRLGFASGREKVLMKRNLCLYIIDIISISIYIYIVKNALNSLVSKIVCLHEWELDYF